MPEPKAQLVDPQGPIDVPGLQVTGVTTATGGFVGQVQGTATGFAATTYNLNVGIVTGTKFQGNTTGNVSGLADDTNINVGIITSTSFTGDLVGNAAGLSTTTANINAGIMSATSFAGNFTGVASGITGTPNIVVGIMTGTLKGDGSNLTGAGSTAFVRQSVTAQSGTTTINLNDGNIIYLTHSNNTTIAFSNVGTAEDITIIRTLTDNTITWPAAITWNGGSAPTLLGANSYSKTGQVFNLVTADGGTTWYGYEEVSNTAEQPSTVWAIGGENADGQLGQGDRTQYSSPRQVGSESDWGEIKTAVCGNDFVLMMKTNNAVWGWGNNEYGMLGQNDQTRRSSPVQIPGTTWALTAAQDQVAGVTNTSGELFTMGYNGWGNLGHNDVANYSSPKQIPGTTWPTSSEGEGRNPIKLGYSNEVVKTDGTLWCWGFNDRGQLGQNNRTNYSSPIQVGSDTTWSCVGGGYESAFGIKTDGTLWAWGTGGHGQLGVNNLTKYSSPVQVGSGTDWKSISQGSASSDRIMAIKTDGTLWAWGSGTKGELAQSTHVSHRSSPVQIPGTTWKMASFGDNHAIAMKTDGTLWTWGNNQLGRLGQSNTTSYSSPVQLPGTWTTTDAGYRWSIATQAYNV